MKISGEEVNFILDTGGGEVILDPELAQKAGVVSVGSETGTFAGGKGADVGQGRLTALTLQRAGHHPEYPVVTRRGSKQVDGILGTMLLYHFLPRGLAKPDRSLRCLPQSG